MKAIVVDDSRAMRRILRGILQDLNFQVIEAGNGIEALEELEVIGPVELMLIDWNMPVMNGLELIKRIRSEDRYKRMKLVMVTTEKEPKKMAMAYFAGADEFVNKAFHKEELIDKLKLIGVKINVAIN